MTHDANAPGQPPRDRHQDSGHAYFARRRRSRVSPSRGTGRPVSPAHRAERYAAYRGAAMRGDIGTGMAASADPSGSGTTMTGSAVPLDVQFAETRALQNQRRATAKRKRPLRRKPWFWAVAGVPAILLIVAAIALSPVLYQTFQAYRDVKVDSAEHQQSAFVPALNQSGTPELVAAPTTDAAPEWTGTEPLTILLLGVDKAANGASRTDTIILVNIDPVSKQASMLSIPRDLKVVIPGYGIDKINAAFALGEFNKVQGGGAGLTIRTIEANLGVPVSHFVQIDFDGFVKMIDTVGGVTLDVPYPIIDNAYPADNFQYQRIYFATGWQHMDGETALQYARTRHQDGDQRRSERQQQVLLALRDQAVNLDLISRIPSLIAEFGDSVRTDIPVNDAVALARLGTEIPRDQISQLSLMPTLIEEQLPNAPYYLVANWNQTRGVLSDFAGTVINPPGAALANPNFGLPVLILNGTDNEGLAGRVGDVLELNGFNNVQVGLADESRQENSSIIDNGGNLGTSAMITNLIGVGADRIEIRDEASGAGVGPNLFATEPPQSTPGVVTDYDVNDYAIVITLGDDAPDPASSELQLDEYQDQVDDGGSPDDGANGGDGTGPDAPEATREPEIDAPVEPDTTDSGL